MCLHESGHVRAGVSHVSVSVSSAVSSAVNAAVSVCVRPDVSVGQT